MLTVAAVYCLILIAGAVRATGSGMGCPDWPTCFGQWIPPTHESQLPADYQQIYADRGYAETTFNAKKTWIEYSNRLVGVLIGILIFLTMLASRGFRKHNALVTKLSVAAFFAVVFQGWLGSRVVASNLHPGMITLHMLLAQAIVAMLICAVMRSQKDVISADGINQLPDIFNKVLIAAMVMTILQMVMGTQVREAIDIIARSVETRSIWIEQLPLISSILLFFNTVHQPVVCLSGVETHSSKQSDATFHISAGCFDCPYNRDRGDYGSAAHSGVRPAVTSGAGIIDFWCTNHCVFIL